MTTEKNLREELLKQDGGSTKKADDLRDMFLATDRARVARMTRLLIGVWAVVAASLVAAAIARLWFPEITEPKPQLVSVLITLFQEGLLLIALIFTISLYVRSRALTMRQIQVRLAGIEEQLKKMAGED